MIFEINRLSNIV